MRAAFVTATGTEVGKTFVACGLIRRLRSQGRIVEALKPVVSGYDPQTAAASDPGRLLDALGETATPESVARISPWRFAAPLSPDLAARAEGRGLDFAALIDFCRKRISAAPDAVLIEGVGGIMVPLDERHTVLDWMAELDIPIILVAGSYLGTFSHTLSALDVLARRDLSVAAIVVSETAGGTVSLVDTVATLRRFAEPVAVFALPRLPDESFGHPAFEEIANALGA